MKRAFRGSSHCGKVQFEIDAEIDHVRVCDCSVCAKRDALVFRVPKHDFRLLTPIDELALHKWGTFTGKDYFCPKCGILTFRKPSDPSLEEADKGLKKFEGWAVNTLCLEGFDTSSVPRKFVHGREIDIS